MTIFLTNDSKICIDTSSLAGTGAETVHCCATPCEANKVSKQSSIWKPYFFFLPPLPPFLPPFLPFFFLSPPSNFAGHGVGFLVANDTWKSKRLCFTFERLRMAVAVRGWVRPNSKRKTSQPLEYDSMASVTLRSTIWVWEEKAG